MNGLEALEIARSALWLVLKIAGPLLLAALTVGLMVSFFQALTQIQEFTLTFIPKILFIFFVLFWMLPFYGDWLQKLSLELFSRIVSEDSFR